MKTIEIQYEEGVKLDREAVIQTGRLADEYRKKLAETVGRGGYDTDEASVNVCDDASLQSTVMRMVEEKKTASLKYVFVIGIGGSNLGTYAVYNAVRGTYGELLRDTLPKMIFIDTVSTALMRTAQQIIEEDIASAEEVCVNVISKSGSTTETIALFEILYGFLRQRFSSAIDQRIVATTDEGSQLHVAAVEKGFSVLFLPKKVGGRYSVFSAVGLFPLALSGVDIQALVDGARMMRDRCLADDVIANPALLSAVLTYQHYQQGIRINNSFFFNPELEMMGKWYRQLMGESVGKAFDTDGKQVHAGITPIVSIGSTDLHSMAQLYFGGPRDKFTCFVYAPFAQEVTVPEDRLFPKLVEVIAGKNLDMIMQAIYGGVKAAYRKNELPYIEVRVPSIEAGTIGQYLQMKMMEMMYLANLMHVNAFDQPNVEDYKEETRRLL